MKAALLLLAIACATARAEGPSEYAYGLAVDTPPGIAFARVSIPAAVYEGAASRNLADLRVFNAGGEVVPYAFVPRTVETVPLTQVPLRMFPLYVPRDRGDVDGLALSVVRSAAGGTTINVTSREGTVAQEQALGGYVLDASERDDPVAALVFAMPDASAATSMRLRIDASDDLVNWRTIRADGTLVLLEHGGQRLVRNRVEFQPAKTKYLRVSWGPARPIIEFTGITGEFGSRPLDPTREWRTVAGSAVADREGEYQYDLGGAFPVDRLAVDLSATNSVVPAAIFARDAPAEAWQPVGTSVFYRIAQPPAEAAKGTVVAVAANDVTSPPFVVDGRPHRYWMLRLDPRAGIPGTSAPALRAGWQMQEVVFAARGNAPFTFAYGKYDAKPGALPIETLIPDYAAKRTLPASVVVGLPAARVDLGGATRLAKPPETKRWVLWGALLLGALVLGWMAWRLSREMTKSESASTDVAGPKPD